jgi:Tfp pilus assembly protein PilN
VRPVNLIPGDQRRRGGLVVPGGGRTPAELAAYGVLGLLGLALVGVVALVLTSNGVNDKKDEVAKLKQDVAAAEAAANALRPYGEFQELQQARVATIRGLAASSFNWARVVHALSRTIPSNAWLISAKGTVAPGVQLEGGGTGGVGAQMRGLTTAPALELTGCTYSHGSVARMMTRMRNIEGVTEVVLADSERPSANVEQEGGAAEAGAGGGGDDCRTRYNITKFGILVVFGELDGGGSGPAPYPRGAVAQALGARVTSGQRNQATAAAAEASGP